MRALAEFIMRGRMQASIVALAGNLVPLISPATVGLVTLRRNYQDGLLVLLWAAIPLLATFFMSNASYLIVLTSLTTLVAVMVSAEVLKKTVSWQVTLSATLAICSLVLLVLGSVFSAETARVSSEVQAVIGSLDALGEEPVSPFYLIMAVTAANLGVTSVTAGFVLGFLAWLTVMHVVGSLLLSRWWQAMLVNPGGFRAEFHSLRLGSMVASVLMAAVILLHFTSPVLAPWGSMMGFPLLLAGVGLVHHTVAALGLGTFWLVLFYVGLVLFGPMSLILVGLGFLDSILDFRTRIVRLRK